MYVCKALKYPIVLLMLPYVLVGVVKQFQPSCYCVLAIQCGNVVAKWTGLVALVLWTELGFRIRCVNKNVLADLIS